MSKAEKIILSLTAALLIIMLCGTLVLQKKVGRVENRIDSDSTSAITDSTIVSDFDERAEILTPEMEKEIELQNHFIEITENTYPEKFQRSLSWKQQATYMNESGVVHVPIISENGTQDLTYFCENICDWLEDCMKEIPYEDAPWLYAEFIVGIPSGEISFDLLPYVSNDYDRQTLYSGLYGFIDQELSKPTAPYVHKTYDKLPYVVGDMEGELFPGTQPECTYTTADGIVYGMLPVDRAAGSSYYILIDYRQGDLDAMIVNRNPFCDMGGQAYWIKFIDDTTLGFACLTYNGGDDAMLFRTEDGGQSYTQINYPSAQVTLSDGTIYNPFTIPEDIWREDDDIYMKAGQSQWSGDYYSLNLDKYPSGLYVSHNDGCSFEYVGEQ